MASGTEVSVSRTPFRSAPPPTPLPMHPTRLLSPSRWRPAWPAVTVLALMSDAHLLRAQVTGDNPAATDTAAVPASPSVWQEPHVLGALLLAVLMLVFLGLFVAEARRHPASVDSHWGGFGGGLGGFRISASVLYLLAALSFGTMAVYLIGPREPPPSDPPPVVATQTPTGAPAQGAPAQPAAGAGAAASDTEPAAGAVPPAGT
jgi:hypothetical protein